MTLVELNLVLTFGLVYSLACRRLHCEVAALVEHVQAHIEHVMQMTGPEFASQIRARKKKGAQQMEGEGAFEL